MVNFKYLFKTEKFKSQILFYSNGSVIGQFEITIL